jgi:hypothetical protein
MAQRDVPSDQPACLVVDDGPMMDSSAGPGCPQPTLRVSALGLLLISLVTALTSAGCDGHDNTGKYTPSTDVARQSLEAALDAWKRGEPAGPIQGTSMAIEVADSKRQPGQTLASYEIVGEVSDDSPRRFTVRLKLENPAQEPETQYVVVGRDPIGIFGEADYALEKGM